MKEAFWKTEIATNIILALEAVDGLGRDLTDILNGVAQQGRAHEVAPFVRDVVSSTLDWLVILRNSLAAMLMVLTAYRLSVSTEEVRAEEWQGIDWERYILDNPDWSGVGSLILSPRHVAIIATLLQEVDNYIFTEEPFAERFRSGVFNRLVAIARIVSEKISEARPPEVPSKYDQQAIERLKETVLSYLRYFLERFETILKRAMPSEKVEEAQRYFGEIVRDLKEAISKENAELLKKYMIEVENFAKAVANASEDKEIRDFIDTLVDELKKKVNRLLEVIREANLRILLGKFWLLWKCCSEGG